MRECCGQSQAEVVSKSSKTNFTKPEDHLLPEPCTQVLSLQLLNAYLGSTFRTIEEIFNDSSSSSSNAVIGAAVLAAQVAVAVGVTVRTIWSYDWRKLKSYFEHFLVENEF